MRATGPRAKGRRRPVVTHARPVGPAMAQSARHGARGGADTAAWLAACPPEKPPARSPARTDGLNTANILSYTGRIKDQTIRSSSAERKALSFTHAGHSLGQALVVWMDLAILSYTFLSDSLEHTAGFAGAGCAQYARYILRYPSRDCSASFLRPASSLGMVADRSCTSFLRVSASSALRSFCLCAASKRAVSASAPCERDG